MKTLRPYPEYKTSEVEWLGDIPAHWEIWPVKYVAQFINGAAFKPTDWGSEGVPIIRIENLNGGEEFNRTTLAAPPKCHVQKGDILFGWSGNRGTSFGPFIWEREGRYYLNQHIFRLEDFDSHRRWLYWMLKAVTLYVEEQAHGIIGMVHITKGDLGVIKVPMPPKTEQQATAEFLDRETARIDGLVAKKERLIALLQEKRAALISHAVTKGLNPAAPMKDSGVEWLGKIPAHWHVGLLKRYARIRYGLGQPPPELPDGPSLIRATNIKSGKILEADMLRVDPAQVPESRGAMLSAGEIIVVRSGAYTGDSAIIPSRYHGAISGYDMVVTVKEGFSPYFAWQLLSPEVRQLQFGLCCLRAAQPHLNAEELQSTIVAVPPPNEQRAIADCLDRETAKLDALIAKIRSGIERLQEYRTALISAAVTGKIDMREEAA